MDRVVEHPQPEVDHRASKRRLLPAVWWAGASKAVSEGARYLRLLVLARLLSPEDFGVFGILVLLLAFLEAFTEPGLGTALLQQQRPVGRYLDSVFLVNAFRSFLLAGAIWGSAPLVAGFWNVPDSNAVLRAASFVVILRGLANPATVVLIRELDFRAIFIWNAVEAVASLAFAVALACSGFSVWALVGSLLAGETAKAVFSYVLRPWRPRLRMRWSDIRELARFSRWVMATNATIFLGLQLDGAVVAKVISPTALAFYQMAQRLAALPRATFIAVLNQVALPALCQAQKEPRRLRRVLAHFWLAAGAIAGIFGALIAIFSRPIVEILLGRNWAPAAPLLAILSLSHFLRSVAVVPSSYFYAVDRPWFTFYMNLARAGGLALTLGPLVSSYDAAGAAWASVVGALALTGTWALGLLRSFGGTGPGKRPEARPTEWAVPGGDIKT